MVQRTSRSLGKNETREEGPTLKSGTKPSRTPHGNTFGQGTDIHSNTIEGVFSLLKRGVYGTFHSISKKHLPNYLNEFEFRHNTRNVDDGTRITRAIQKADGKRLTYRDSVDNPPYAVLPEQPHAPFEG
jgi:hypothetical protein